METSLDTATPLIPLRKLRQQVLGLDLLHRLAERGHRIFSTEQMLEMAADLGLATKDVTAALTYLQAEGWIALVRRGVHAITTALPGCHPCHPYEIAASLVSPSAFSHWSALYLHQLTPLTPPYHYVLTHTTSSLPRYRRKQSSLPPDIYPVGSFLFRFVQVKNIRFFGVETRVENKDFIQLTDLERTLWDSVSMPQYAGGWAHVEDCCYAARDRLDVERLITYALKGDHATSKRLGWLLEYQGKSEEALLPLLKIPMKGYRLLDASAPAMGPCNSRWNLQVNTLG